MYTVVLLTNMQVNLVYPRQGFMPFSTPSEVGGGGELSNTPTFLNEATISHR